MKSHTRSAGESDRAFKKIIFTKAEAFDYHCFSILLFHASNPIARMQIVIQMLQNLQSRRL
jgi:hypothetical protein